MIPTSYFFSLARKKIAKVAIVWADRRRRSLRVNPLNFPLPPGESTRNATHWNHYTL